MRQYHVYIMASLSGCIYVGVTNDLSRRVWQHRYGSPAGFTTQYHVTKLVYFEDFSDVRDAIAREKQLKHWPRWRKERLIERTNAGWEDLSTDWFGQSG
jgi:putative endonuclease